MPGGRINLAVGRMGSIAAPSRRGNFPNLGRNTTWMLTLGPEQRWSVFPGSPFLYTAANWGSQLVYLEAYLRSTSGKAMVRLYDVTAAAAVAGSTITINLAGGTVAYARSRSAALTLTDGNSYQIQVGTQDGGAGGLLSAKLVII